MSAQVDLFAAGATRLVYDEAVELTLASLLAYGPQHAHWCIAWSGGKDSTATLTLIIHLIVSGRLPQPKTLTVYYADTRQELPPLALAAVDLMDQLARFPWIRLRVVTAPLDKRFLVYILGRGVPPPNNNTLRWCTRQIKVDPMAAAIAADLDGGAATGPAETVLMITGVRQGESAVRDRRIEMSCSKDGAECGQGWYQQVLPQAKGVRGRIATLAPLLHWRVCHVWDWLKIFAPHPTYGGWSTSRIANAYGGDEAEELNARTGCCGCPLASKDLALDRIVADPAWDHYAPLQRLKPIYRALRLPRNRLRKAGIERLAPPAYRGKRIGIHAGARPVRRSEIVDLVMRLRSPEAWTTCLRPDIALPILEKVLTSPGILPTAHMLGTALLGEPIRAHEIVGEFGGVLNDSDRGQHANFAWPLTDIVPFEPPVPARGAQGFWPWSEGNAP